MDYERENSANVWNKLGSFATVNGVNVTPMEMEFLRGAFGVEGKKKKKTLITPFTPFNYSFAFMTVLFLWSWCKNWNPPTPFAGIISFAQTRDTAAVVDPLNMELGKKLMESGCDYNQAKMLGVMSVGLADVAKNAPPSAKDLYPPLANPEQFILDAYAVSADPPHLTSHPPINCRATRAVRASSRPCWTVAICSRTFI